MITENGWFDWAIKDPGPLARWLAFDLARTPMDAIYHHSLEGWFNPVSSDGYNVMKDPARHPTGWHGTVVKRNIWYPTGTLVQHYPVFARLQHANGGNIIGPGFETEGVQAQPLLPEQVATWLRIHADMRAFTGKAYPRIPGNGRIGLCEHREAPGGNTTECPSERYAPLWAAIANGDDVVSQADFDKALARIAQLETQMWGENPKIPRTKYNDFSAQEFEQHMKTHGTVTGQGMPKKFDATIEVK